MGGPNGRPLVVAAGLDVGVVFQELGQFAGADQIPQYGADRTSAVAAASGGGSPDGPFFGAGELPRERFVSWFVRRSVGLHYHRLRFRS